MHKNDIGFTINGSSVSNAAVDPVVKITNARKMSKYWTGPEKSWKEWYFYFSI